jgi:type I restriction enzyme, S subunit
MRGDWQIVPMGQLCTITSGKSDTQDAVEDGPYAFFDRSRTIKRSSRFLHDRDALIIPGEGTEFLPKHFTGKFDLHQRAYALFDFSPRIDIKYLYYFLHYLSDYFPRVAVGATVKSLRRRHFEQLPVALTNISEQQRIVDILDETFEEIATAKDNAEKNRRSARDIFESYLQSIFTQRGNGWEEKRLADIAEFKNGLNFTRQSKGQTLRMVGVGDFHEHSIVPIETLQSVTIDGELADDYLIRRDDILTVRSNGSRDLVGRCMLVPDVDEMTSFSGFIIRIRFNTREISPRFLLHFMKSSETRKRLTRDGGGANISNINQAKLSELPISLPPFKQQEDIAKRLDHLRLESQRLAGVYERKLGALEALKKSMLHQAFTGQLGAKAA